MERVKASLRRVVVVLRKYVGPPSKREIRSWIVDEDAPAVVQEGGSLWVAWGRFVGFWGRIRTRVFRVAAGILALVDLALAIVLYSNVWYMNLILWGITVPNFLILIHYLRLTRGNRI